MSDSYPRRDQARGLWKINDITKNIKEDGTYPQLSLGDRMLVVGGSVGGATNVMQSLEVSTTGNSVDFGDLAISVQELAAASNATRFISGGGATPSLTNTINYVNPHTTGNASDFGDLTTARQQVNAGGNSTIGVFSGGRTPSATNLIDFVTYATLGNATDYGDLTVSRWEPAVASNPTRLLTGGGYGGSTGTNTIDLLELASTGNAADFGDLTSTFNAASGLSSSTRWVQGGGYDYGASGYSTSIQSVEFGSLGNAIEFGDLSAAKNQIATASNKTRGIFAGGTTPSTSVNVIEFITIASRSDVTDFGDLLAANVSCAGGCTGNGGIETFVPRAPELYSPTGTVISRGGGAGDICILGGGESPSPDTSMESIQISILSNASDFGDLITTPIHDLYGSTASAERLLFLGGSGPSNVIQYIEFDSKGNAADFGNLTASAR